MDHVVDGPPGDRRPSRESSEDLGRVTVTADARAGPAAAAGQVPGLRLVEPALAARAARPGRRRARRAPGTPAGTACWPSQREYLDDFWERARRRDRGRRRAPAGGPLRALPRAAGRRPRRAAGDPRQGPDRDRATTATPSGTPRRSSCRVLTYTVPDAARDALRWRHATLDLARERAEAARARGRRLPVADDPRRGVLGLLAGRHRRLPRQRRHRRRGRSATSRHRRRGVRARGGPRAAGRDGAAVALARPPRRRRDASASTASPGPDEYSAIADNNVYTNLMAQRNLRGAADAVERHPDRRAELGVDAEEAAAWRDAAAAMSSPTTRRSASTPRRRASPSTRLWDFDEHAARPVPAAAALPLLRPLPQAGRQAGRPRAGAAPARRRLHRRGRRRATSTTTRRSPSATRRCRPARRR